MNQTAPAKAATGGRSATEVVVSAVAELTAHDPLDLDPLYDAVPPSAVDALMGGAGPHADRTVSRLSFAYAGCDVTVTGDGTVRVSDGENEIVEDYEYR